MELIRRRCIGLTTKLKVEDKSEISPMIDVALFGQKNLFDLEASTFQNIFRLQKKDPLRKSNKNRSEKYVGCVAWEKVF